MSEETIADILAEMFDFSDKRIEEGRDHAMTSECVGLIVHQLAKRFEAAWKREREADTRLLFRLLWFDVDDYQSDWATPVYQQVVKDCCQRLGIPYHDSGREIAKAMEEHVLAGKGGAK